MKNYHTTVSDSNELKKYVNRVQGTTIENGISKEMITLNIFYFNHDALIKVDEFGIVDGKEAMISWYYADGKSLYYTAQSDQSEERAQFLLTLSNTLLKQFQQNLPRRNL